MADELAAPLRRELLDVVIDDEQPELRITEVTIDQDAGGLGLEVAFAQQDQRGRFSRTFDEVDLRMLTEETLEETAAAIATWVRLELVEYVSELTAAGQWRYGL